MTQLSPLRAEGLINPAEVLEGKSDVTEVRLLMRSDRAVYDLHKDGQPVVSVDARTGEVLSPISKDAARIAALADFLPGASFAEVELLREDPPLEYRGRPLPVYRVRLDHSKRPNIYVSVVTGEVVTRRNADWRLFDFFWMLHIMDYGEREDFNHPLLTSMSLLAVLTSVSGLVLWCWRAPWRRHRRRAADG